MKAFVAGALMAAMAFPAIAQNNTPPVPSAARPTGCALFTQVFENGLKDLSEMRVQDIGDDSAPRATMRAARATQIYAQMAVNLELMAAAKCPLPKDAVSDDWYLGAALTCRATSATDPAFRTACDRAAWRRDP